MKPPEPVVVVGKSAAYILSLPFYLIGILVQLLLYLLLRFLELLYRLTKNGTARFFPNDVYPWTATVEQHWPEIRSELDELLPNVDAMPNYQDIAPSQKSLTSDDKWKVVVFKVMDRRVDANAQACPRTADLIDSIPGLLYAMFSVLKPGKEIAPHRGPYGGSLNCHLAVRVPKESEKLGIRVGGEVGHWKEGRMLIFNDRYTHEAWNHSDETRVVLLMYVVRPLPFPLSSINQAMITFANRFLRSREMEQIRKLAEQAGLQPPQESSASP